MVDLGRESTIGKIHNIAVINELASQFKKTLN